MKYLVVFLYVFSFGSVFSQKVIIDEPLRFLALGDSYTIGQNVTVDDRWPVQFINALQANYGIEDAEVDIIARTGWTTQNLLSGIELLYDDTKDYNLVSLLIGVNNQYQKLPLENYLPDFRELLEIAIEIAGGDPKRVFVVSIPDYSYTPSHASVPGIRSEIDEYNRINREESNKQGVAYFDVTGISRMGLTIPSYVANDGLHPSGLQYKEWVEKIVHEIFNPTGKEIPEVTNDSSLSYSIGNGSLKVSLPEPGGLISLIDVSGRTISKAESYDKIVELEVNQIIPGVYFLDYLYENKRLSQTVFID